MTPDLLTLTGLEVFAHHGVFDFERENGQRFVIDVELALDTAPAAGADDLAQTVHYGELAIEISDAVAADPVDLIETLAERVAGVVLAHPPVQRVRVVVHKPDAPIPLPFSDVSITIVRHRASASAPHAATTGTPAHTSSAPVTGDAAP
ncbi:dihydroneopterin aldolase [Herbiconiux sp.]|uniref:dihydroneopterin aldolase n=1 Tax=Herbiconiux sp. TaxID=1871186 RepID=UPI0025BA4CFB|nr:dihydroneopterin aldolase [Herbiconiux sp.]